MKHLPLKYSARGIILNHDGHVLLVKHASHKPWTLPGGHVEENETFQDALIREAREELDIAIELIGMVTIHKESFIRSLPAPVRVEVIEYSNEHGPQKKYTEFFLAQYLSGTITPQKSEIASYIWMSQDVIRSLKKGEIYESIRDCIVHSVV